MRELRRDDRRSDRRREESRDRRINTADYVVEELYGSTGHAEVSRGQLSRDAELYDSEDSRRYSVYGQDEEAKAEDDGDYVDVGSQVTEVTRLGPRGTRLNRADDRLMDETAGTPRENDSCMDRALRMGTWATRLTFGGDVFCKQVHEISQCELFRRYEKLVSFVKNNVDKANVPDELQDLDTPSDLNSPANIDGVGIFRAVKSAESVVEANFVFAFVGEAGWPEGSDGMDEGIRKKERF
ncbi:LOW QUALITY PROTEIN: Hypothetical protein PHPALM_6199 [Phytophthora palmivora]|uniref:Uncharacterized protein n=1 Tax=Phytophthora palmivora TaxID=4796 RepID=A0A2P4YFE4_9STRA|nr:LOW QUALITY PROTEIN: Hypothetical protein PHPALM_6199 [Phytophthora palmivora]